MTTPDLAGLVLRAQVGDRAALGRLLAALQNPLVAYLRTLVGDDAPDVLQETLIRVATKLKHLRTPGAVRAWAFRIAGREAFKRLRGQRRRAEVALDAQTPMGVVPLTQTELAAEVYLLDKALRQLPPAARAVVWLHYIGQMSIADGRDAGDQGGHGEVAIGVWHREAARDRGRAVRWWPTRSRRRPLRRPRQSPSAAHR